MQRRHCQASVSGQPARNCWHIRRSETHTPSGVCGEGFFFFFYPLIGSRKWMLWENICGRECGELSRTARTHGLGLRAEGGWVGGGAEGQQASARRGFKKAEPGVWWAEWCMFFPPFPSASACFSQRGLRNLPTLMRCVQTGHRKQRLVFSSACIVCIISSHCLAKALCN